MDNLEKILRDVETGDVDAMYRLGEAYLAGEVTGKKDVDLGVKFLQLAANQGHLDALYSCGELFATISDYKSALPCFLKAADKGHKKSWTQLYLYYLLGKGTKQDPDKALFWAKKAFKSGDKDAAFVIAGILESKGKDKKAQKYYKISYENGNELAKKHIKDCN